MVRTRARRGISRASWNSRDNSRRRGHPDEDSNAEWRHLMANLDPPFEVTRGLASTFRRVPRSFRPQQLIQDDGVDINSGQYSSQHTIPDFQGPDVSSLDPHAQEFRMGTDTMQLSAEQEHLSPGPNAQEAMVEVETTSDSTDQEDLLLSTELLPVNSTVLAVIAASKNPALPQPVYQHSNSQNSQHLQGNQNRVRGQYPHFAIVDGSNRPSRPPLRRRVAGPAAESQTPPKRETSELLINDPGSYTASIDENIVVQPDTEEEQLHRELYNFGIRSKSQTNVKPDQLNLALTRARSSDAMTAREWTPPESSSTAPTTAHASTPGAVLNNTCSSEEITPATTDALSIATNNTTPEKDALKDGCILESSNSRVVTFSKPSEPGEEHNEAEDTANRVEDVSQVGKALGSKGGRRRREIDTSVPNRLNIHLLTSQGTYEEIWVSRLYWERVCQPYQCLMQFEIYCKVFPKFDEQKLESIRCDKIRNGYIDKMEKLRYLSNKLRALLDGTIALSPIRDAFISVDQAMKKFEEELHETVAAYELERFKQQPQLEQRLTIHISTDVPYEEQQAHATILDLQNRETKLKEEANYFMGNREMIGCWLDIFHRAISEIRTVILATLPGVHRSRILSELEDCWLSAGASRS